MRITVTVLGVRSLSEIQNRSQTPGASRSCNIGDVLGKDRLRFGLGIVGLGDGNHLITCPKTGRLRTV